MDQQSNHTKAFELSDIILRYLSGYATQHEQQIIQKWLETSEKNRELLERIQDNQHLLKKIDRYTTIDTRKAYDRFLEKRREYDRKKRRIFLYRYSLGTAAALFLIIGIVWFVGDKVSKETNIAQTETKIIPPGSSKAILKLSDGRIVPLNDQKVTLDEPDGTLITGGQNNTLTYQEQTDSLKTGPEEILFNTLEVPTNGEFSMILADGSQVWIGACSKLKYPVSFTGDTRTVYLEGEAFFEVAPDKNKPFIVRTKNFSVKALGTSFNIMNYEDESFAHTTLKSGFVEVSHLNETMRLTPGEQALVENNSTMTKRDVNVDVYTAWMSDLFRFDKEDIGVVMRKIARWYGVNIIYQNISVSDYHFIGALPKYNNLDQTLNLLEQTTNIKFIIEDNTVIVCNDPQR